MVPKRQYGKHRDELTILGFGGIVVMNLPQEQANRTAQAAFDRGINYFDVATTYGNAEERLGPAIRPFRQKIFLASKTEKRTAKESQEALERSLKLLKTDHLDLYQMHAMTTLEEVEQVFAPGGAMETLLRAREQGKTRYLGFSAHGEAAAVELLKRFPFDSVLFPLNFASLYKGNFGWKLIETARKQGTALLALKTFAMQKWAPDADRSGHPKCWYEPIEDPALAERAFRFTLSLPNVVAAVSTGDENLFPKALDIAERYRPISTRDKGALRKLAMDLDPLFPQA